MNIIANSCVGGHLYKLCLNQPFQNPFMWNLINFDSMLYLINNYDDIDFDNYELKKNGWEFSLTIDDHINIQYIHYRFNANYRTPTRIGMDVFYNKIWEYIVEKYEERKNRMMKSKERPIFILANWWNRQETKLTHKEVKILNDLHKDNIIVGVDKIYPEYSNVKQITRETGKQLYNSGLARKIYEQFIK